MRIGITNDLHNNGGAVSLMAERYARALRDAGHDVTVICGAGADAVPPDLAYETWRYPDEGRDSPLAMLRLYRKLRARGADAFGRWVMAGPRPDLWIALVIPSAMAALDGGGRRFPLLYVCNSPWEMEWLAGRRIRDGCEPAGIARLAGVLPRRMAERRVVSRARAWMANHELQMEWFRSVHPGCRGIAGSAIPCAVDCGEFMPLHEDERAAIKARWNVPARTPLLVCSRRLVARTGVDLLLDALKQLLTRPRLVITGDGPERAGLEQRAAALGIAGQVTFAGFLPRAELVALTGAADLAVLPTRELEGFGFSAVEAMAAGVPAVATDVGALRDVLGGLDERLIASRPDQESLHATLTWALGADGVLTAEWRTRSRAYVEQRYDWRRLKRDFVALCERTARP